MKLFYFLILLSFALDATSKDALAERESYQNEYNSRYCENKKFLICASIEKEECILAIEDATKVCSSKYPELYEQTTSPKEPLIYFICMRSQLPQQKELKNEETEFCLDLPSTKRNESL